MIDIIECLKKRIEYPLYSGEDLLLKEAITDQTKPSVALVLLEGFLWHAKELEQVKLFCNKYHIAGEISLGRPYVSSELHFSLVIGTAKKQEKYRTSIYKGLPYREKTMVGMATNLVMPNSYTESFQSYIANVEKWFDSGVIPEDDAEGQYGFCESNCSYTAGALYYPAYYSKKKKQIENLLESEEIIRLGNIAGITVADSINENGDSGKAVLLIDELKPYSYDNVRFEYRRSSNIQLQNGDILYPRNASDAKPYLVRNLVNADVYGSDQDFVIRCYDIQPEYLWLYLTSDVSEHVFSLLTTKNVIKIINEDQLKDFPIIKPKLNPDYYKKLCTVLTNESVRNPGIMSERDYKSLLLHEASSVGDILGTELIQSIHVYQSEQLRGFLESDLEELNRCFTAKAYKATLILAGSVLEAFLIDWLSELEGINYFEEELMVSRTIKTENKKEKISVKAGLIDYIDRIRIIKKPDWVKQAGEAHDIRKKRNLVHAKLCLSDSDEINEETCRMVLSYLKDVLETRTGSYS